MLFSEFMDTNKSDLKSLMLWDNFGLNDITLIPSEELKEKAWLLLKQNYGKFEVEDILPEMSADISINFPILMQSLSIALSMTYQSVSKVDIETETRTITETGTNTHNSTQTDNSTRNTIDSDDIISNVTLTGEVSDTGTISTAETSDRTEVITVLADNSTVTPITGSKSVALSHAMPEQSISGVTNNFPVDSQGTPDLSQSSVQSANESFSTINEFQNNQSIDQTQTTTSDIENSNVVTNNTVSSTDNSTEEITSKDSTGSDILEATTVLAGNDEVEHTTVDEVQRSLANKQYPYEISKFLESIDTVKSFTKWIDAFSWVCGVY